MKVSFGDAGVKFWKLGKKISLKSLLIVRKPECDEVGSEVNARAALEDVGHNADLYIAIQEDNMQN